MQTSVGWDIKKRGRLWRIWLLNEVGNRLQNVWIVSVFPIMLKSLWLYPANGNSCYKLWDNKQWAFSSFPWGSWSAEQSYKMEDTETSPYLWLRIILLLSLFSISKIPTISRFLYFLVCPYQEASLFLYSLLRNL